LIFLSAQGNDAVVHGQTRYRQTNLFDPASAACRHESEDMPFAQMSDNPS